MPLFSFFLFISYFFDDTLVGEPSRTEAPQKGFISLKRGWLDAFSFSVLLYTFLCFWKDKTTHGSSQLFFLFFRFLFLVGDGVRNAVAAAVRIFWVLFPLQSLAFLSSHSLLLTHTHSLSLFFYRLYSFSIAQACELLSLLVS